ncbi:hypothetical protein GCK72_015825 [Caenorhabditis remanei]|uniref:DUF281 domain-containing protein n=1 Tax=Caenorhabditis remanei TaxID=31234 RepID=A0A6A5GV63_CAERE|nr:hypothetical protein GCK72_015825 [Caenorhabditis remanei]KAF1759358.1 hypothetical protein GCK72_015825 [Caenorhabditis remanei]
MNYLLFFLLVSLVNCKGCKDQCECPDLLDKLTFDRDNVLYTEEAGCVRNITCKTDVTTWVGFSFNKTEISRPDDAPDFAIANTLNDEVPTGPNINLFEFFGMICENKEWSNFEIPPETYDHSDGVDIIRESDGLLATIKINKSEVLYTEEAGCFRNITCLTYEWTWVRFNYNETEIARPVNATYWGAAETIDTTIPAEPQKSIVNLFEFFGMVCENNEWYITKYPHGFSYSKPIGNENYVYQMKNNNGELDGKKSKVFEWACMPPSWCECPDLLDKLQWPDRSIMLYTEEAGCVRNLTCETDASTWVNFLFNETEISRPDNARNDGMAPTSENSDETIEIVNIFQYFGMICENNEWYITKYPRGILYGSTTIGEKFVMGTNGELDGKKSKIDRFGCIPPGYYS